MKKLKLFFYFLVIVFLAFILVKVNFSDQKLSSLLPNNVNTSMNISEGKINTKSKEQAAKNDNKNRELFATYSIKNDNDKSVKNLYKISNFNKIGLIDENDRIIAKPIYDEITEFDAENYLYKTKLNARTGLLSLKSGLLIPAKFQDIEKTENDDIVLIKNYKYYGLYDTKNRQFVLKPIYAQIENLNKYNWKINFSHKIGLVFSKNGKITLLNPKYSDIEPYKNVFKSYKGEKVGLVSYQNAEILTEPLYSDIELLNDENDFVQVFKTSADNRFGVIYYSKNGELTVIPPIYDDVQYNNEKVYVLSGGYRRILDNHGNVTTR